MGIFEKFYQMQNVEDVDGNGVKGIENGGKIIKKKVLSLSTTRAQSTFSTKWAKSGKNVEDVEEPHQQKTDLPLECPFNTGGKCPPGCRFDTKFFHRMIETGVLPDPVKGCPLKDVCGLEKKH